MRVPRRSDEPPADTAKSPDSQKTTPRNAAPEVDERSAPTVRRGERPTEKARAAKATPPPPATGGGDGDGEDTLLSAPAPADHFEVDVERRLEETERRLDQLEADIARLPERRTASGPALAQTACSGSCSCSLWPSAGCCSTRCAEPRARSPPRAALAFARMVEPEKDAV